MNDDASVDAATRTVIENAYAAFNARDVDAALALMTPDVHWPKASEGGSVVGPDEIRAYWRRQWSEFDPHVEPLGIRHAPVGASDVTVRQIVKDLDGNILADDEVTHRFTLVDGRIAAMELVASGDGRSSTDAFRH